MFYFSSHIVIWRKNLFRSTHTSIVAKPFMTVPVNTTGIQRFYALIFLVLHDFCALYINIVLLVLLLHTYIQQLPF